MFEAQPEGPIQGYRATCSASATRTDTSIHETPLAITVVPKDVVEDISANRLQDALDFSMFTSFRMVRLRDWDLERA